MINEQQHYEAQLEMHPGILQVCRIPDNHPGTENNGQDHGWCGDHKPQLFFHNLVLIAQNGGFRFRFFPGFNVVDKQPDHVKKSRKPANDENDMQRFDCLKIHGVKVSIPKKLLKTFWFIALWIDCFIFVVNEGILENTLKKLKSIYPLSEKSLEALIALMHRKNFPKGELILKADRVEESLFFLEKGIARGYCDFPDNQLTFWFGEEGDYIISAQSLINKLPGYETIELLEDSILYEINADELVDLFSTNIELANWGRKLAELELLKLEERFILRQFKTAKETYLELMKNSPSLIQRVQLQYIASYLGISQVTLSRIRAEIK